METRNLGNNVFLHGPKQKYKQKEQQKMGGKNDINSNFSMKRTALFNK